MAEMKVLESPHHALADLLSGSWWLVWYSEHEIKRDKDDLRQLLEAVPEDSTDVGFYEVPDVGRVLLLAFDRNKIPRCWLEEFLRFSDTESVASYSSKKLRDRLKALIGDS